MDLLSTLNELNLYRYQIENILHFAHRNMYMLIDLYVATVKIKEILKLYVNVHFFNTNAT